MVGGVSHDRHRVGGPEAIHGPQVVESDERASVPDRGAGIEDIDEAGGEGPVDEVPPRAWL